MLRLRIPAAVVVALACAPAHADDPADVDALIELVRARPTGMKREVWLEKRRDAARQLGRLGDKRAVPVLIEVVQTEKFDVVAEIAIEALGRLGDERAIPVLREVYGDASRDQYVRDAAATALRRLGADPRGDDGGSSDDDDEDGNGGGGATTGSDAGTGLLGDDGRRDLPKGPAFGDDVLAATERLTFAVGGVSVTYDTLRSIAAIDGDAAARYDHTIARERSAYRYGGEAQVAAGVLDLDGDDNLSRELLVRGSVDGDAQFFLSGSPLYGHVQGGLALSIYAYRIDFAAADDVKEIEPGIDLSFGIGVGRGRLFEVGEGLRLRRIEKVLARARMLGRPITPELGARILRTWWALRGERGYYRRLQATVALLRDAGVLLGEPDAGTTYELLAVLQDGALDARSEGFDVRVGLLETYLYREEDSPAFVDGRVETAFALARFARQSRDGTRELTADGLATLRLFNDEDAGEPAPWSASARVAWRTYFYGDHWDPIGALEFAGLAGLSDADLGDATNVASRLGGSVGWLWIPNRASRFRLAGDVVLESGEMFVGITFTAAYGLLDTSFVAGSAMPQAIP